MRTALALPVGLLLALAASRAAAQAPAAPSAHGEAAPRVTMELTYTRGPGTGACPDERAFRGAVRSQMGYDPFEAVALLRLAASIERRKGVLAATLELRDTTGRVVWENRKLADPFDCQVLVRAMAVVLSIQLEPEPPDPCPACPPPPPPPVRAAAPPPEPAPPAKPEPAPRQANSTALRLAVVGYLAAVGLLIGGIAFTVDAKNKEDGALLLADRLHNTSGQYVCSASGTGASTDCTGLVSAWQARDNAVGFRNAFYGTAGVFAAAGTVATLWAANVFKAPPRAQVGVAPGGVVVQGSF